MKKLPENLELEFSISRPIDAICGQKHLQFAVGRYRTTDPEVARWLYRYPGTELVAARPIPEPGPDTKVYSPVPEQPKVISGGFSGGGAQACKNRKSER